MWLLEVCPVTTPNALAVRVAAARVGVEVMRCIAAVRRKAGVSAQLCALCFPGLGSLVIGLR
jgi:hypothetical protein